MTRRFVPPPIASAAPPMQPPARLAPPDPLWSWLVKWLAYIGMINAVALLLSGVLMLAVLREWMSASFAFSSEGVLRHAVPTLLFQLGMPVVMLASTIGVLKGKPSARTLLIVYAWVHLILIALSVGNDFYHTFVAFDWQLLMHSLHESSTRVPGATYPFIVLLLMTHPQVKAMFVPPARGFEMETTRSEP